MTFWSSLATATAVSALPELIICCVLCHEHSTERLARRERERESAQGRAQRARLKVKESDSSLTTELSSM